ncbi:uncharacterized protein FSUBG_13022 [Fusarium subglutinans]|uniref:Uncharacterized protein n=1 Tax=Gibberella subglutinans TaxID=42677 RepID=A0A8H5L1N4_GIBSU|nr:uncharacterized protein FSUBG_13022 [Fusarium subglutinans]KAF5583767.1 hypothetical protein FSUBG_13022 [Fusarium subglutinans]
MKIEGFRNGFVIASETDTLLLFHGWMDPMSELILPLPFHPGSFQRLPTPKKWEFQQISSRVPTSSEEHRDVSQKPEKPKIQGKTRFSGSLPFHHVQYLRTVTLCSGFPYVSDAGTRYEVPVLEM